MEYSPSPTSPTFPMEEPHQLEEDPPQVVHSYYEPRRTVYQESGILDKISKETLIFGFTMLIIGLLLGKSLTPIILKH